MNEFGDTAVCALGPCPSADPNLIFNPRTSNVCPRHTILGGRNDVTKDPARAINVSSGSDPLAQSSEEFLELSNGCLCCSIKDSGVAAIEKLMQRKGAFDYILLETTGLADPGTSSILAIQCPHHAVCQGPIASIFWRNEEFNRGKGKDIVLDGVVCVVDAVFGKQVGTLIEII